METCAGNANERWPSREPREEGKRVAKCEQCGCISDNTGICEDCIEEAEQNKPRWRIDIRVGDVEVSFGPTVPLTYEEAVKEAERVTSDPKLPYKPYTLKSLGAGEDWQEGRIKFCPKCGAFQGNGSGWHQGEFNCTSCKTDMHIEFLETEE